MFFNNFDALIAAASIIANDAEVWTNTSANYGITTAESLIDAYGDEADNWEYIGTAGNVLERDDD